MGGQGRQCYSGAGSKCLWLKVCEAASLEESEHRDFIGGSRHEAVYVEVLFQLP